jgi:hypothetical protein
VSHARHFYRFTLGLSALGALTSVLVLVAAARSLGPGLPTLEAVVAACRRVLLLPLDVPSLLVSALAALGAVVLVRATRSMLRAWLSQRRFRRSLLTAGDNVVCGTHVTWIDDARVRAFCAGLFSPRVHISLGARQRLSAEQLEAVVAHEHHHARRRDPLRMLILSALAEGVFFMPALSGLADRYRALAEIAADESAVRQAGIAPLASALLAFGRHDNPHAVVGIAPERVDHLLGRRSTWQPPTRPICASALGLVALVALALSAQATVGTSGVGLADAVMSACSLALLALPIGAVLFATGLLRSLPAERTA